MARIEQAAAALGKRRAEGGCGHESGLGAVAGEPAAEEYQHMGRAVELAVPTAAAGAGDKAAPWLADRDEVRKKN